MKTKKSSRYEMWAPAHLDHTVFDIVLVDSQTPVGQPIVAPSANHDTNASRMPQAHADVLVINRSSPVFVEAKR